MNKNNVKESDDILPDRDDELGQLCTKVFQAKPCLPSSEPNVKLPLRKLQRFVSSVKIDKSSISKIKIHKDFMKKVL